MTSSVQNNYLIMKRKYLVKIISKIPFCITRRINHTPLIGYYHTISDETLPHITHLYNYKNKKEFVSDIDFLFNTYKAGDLKDLEKNKNKTQRYFYLTFDDGFSQIFNIIAPILHKKGITATFFINTKFIDNKHLCHTQKASILVHKLKKSSVAQQKEAKKILLRHKISADNLKHAILTTKYKNRFILDQLAPVFDVDYHEFLQNTQPYLTSEQISLLMDQGFSIGAHSIDHPPYKELTENEQLQQTITSIKEIKKRFEINYAFFAFPYSDQGVSDSFFTSLHKTGAVDMTFGTGGLLNERIPHHFQRMSLESPIAPAKDLLTFHLWRKKFKNR